MNRERGNTLQLKVPRNGEFESLVALQLTVVRDFCRKNFFPLYAYEELVTSGDRL